MKNKYYLKIFTALAFLLSFANPVFGEEMSKATQSFFVSDIVLISFAFVFFLGHLALFYISRDKGTLYFGFFCMMIGFHFFFQNPQISSFYSLEFPSKVYIWGVIGLWGAFFLLSYCSSISSPPQVAFWVYLIFCVILSVGFLFVPDEKFKSYYSIYQILLGAIFIYYLIYLGLTLWKGTPENKKEVLVFFISLIVALVTGTGVRLVQAELFLQGSSKIPHYVAVLLVILSQTYILIARHRNNNIDLIKKKQ